MAGRDQQCYFLSFSRSGSRLLTADGTLYLLGTSWQEHCSGDHKRHLPPIPLCEILCHIPLPQFLTKGSENLFPILTPWLQSRALRSSRKCCPGTEPGIICDSTAVFTFPTCPSAPAAQLPASPWPAPASWQLAV